MEIKGSEIVKRIDEQRRVLGFTRKEVAISAGLKSGQSIKDWEKGSIPQADTALHIADVLNVTVRWLLTGVDDNRYTLEERNLVNKFYCLDEQGQFEIQELLKAKLTVLQKKRSSD